MEKLGIEPSLLLAQIINFAIIVVVLSKLLYRPVLAMLEKRKREIEEGLAITERMRQEEEKLGMRREKLLADARREARVILDEAKKQGEQTRHEIVDAAHKESWEIVQKAKREVQAEHEALEGAIQKEAVELATIMTKRLIASVLSSQDQHTLIEKHLKELAKHTRV
jgi:F-type H+-transporting ATPase subunit b